MIAQVPSAEESTPLRQALRSMLEGKEKLIAVIDGQRKLVGVVDRADILRGLAGPTLTCARVIGARAPS